MNAAISHAAPMIAEPMPVAKLCLPDADALALHVAAWLTDKAETSEGRFSLALSGGSTPLGLYRILAGAPYRERFPWARTHVFWVDERFVPYDDAPSNFGAARAVWLSRVPIPAAHLHPMPTRGNLVDAAGVYQRELADYYGSDEINPARPLFDVTLLGLGEDGHTASLFPRSVVLDDAVNWVAPVSDGVPPPRLTLTFPALASSHSIAFLVAGDNKKAMLRRALAGDVSVPAARVRAASDLIWFFDGAASS